MNSEDDSRQINHLPSVEKTRVTARIVEQKPENRLARPSAPPHSTGPQDDALGLRSSAGPQAQAADDLPDITPIVSATGRAP